MTYVSSRVRETVAPGIDRKSRLTLAALTSFLTFPRLFRQWRQRVSDRRHLSELDDHILADFGLTRQEVIDEAAKPFWRPLDPGSGRS
ncbi:DUF1127 domain-containing protein [Chelativorans sp. AA-79]|uniref:DUF1127 domain-containing protein n=1 Tax=Chelativorans sp. AA-79 TaxID=3028735 RepID=UPI0023F63A65|nr:DUF1127 domain-containing protein [Chelativorans sp. AA-79]WEX08024.1 DUF1127 domain-containing protein [Chelativorans sp. AA-79]